jgi:hypothetical protein
MGHVVQNRNRCVKMFISWGSTALSFRDLQILSFPQKIKSHDENRGGLTGCTID